MFEIRRECDRLVNEIQRALVRMTGSLKNKPNLLSICTCNVGEGHIWQKSRRYALSESNMNLACKVF